MTAMMTTDITTADEASDKAWRIVADACLEAALTPGLSDDDERLLIECTAYARRAARDA